jgi:hypothetical protein
MKKITSSILAGIVGIMVLALATSALAEGKEITITGQGQCAKCALKEADKCQTVVEVERGGRKTKYYMVENDVSKEFHGNVCKEAKKVKAIGTVKTVDGKKEFTATKIEVVN